MWMPVACLLLGKNCHSKCVLRKEGDRLLSHSAGSRLPSYWAGKFSLGLKCSFSSLQCLFLSFWKHTWFVILFHPCKSVLIFIFIVHSTPVDYKLNEDTKYISPFFSIFSPLQWQEIQNIKEWIKNFIAVFFMTVVITTQYLLILQCSRWLMVWGLKLSLLLSKQELAKQKITCALHFSPCSQSEWGESLPFHYTGQKLWGFW